MKTIKALLLFLFSSTFINVLFSQNASQYKSYSDIIRVMRDTIPKMMTEKKIVGLSVAIVDEKGIIWEEGFGFTTRDQKISITPLTNFSIQSMSKNFTALAILHAVQDGLLGLDKPITDYIPWFTVNSRFEEHPEKKMTLRLLLSHRAGFTHEAPIGNNYDFYDNKFEDHVKSISNTWLRFPVGERYSYSNLGIDIAGFILQQVTGMPFDQYIKKKIYDPIGMDRSSFDIEMIKKMEDRAIGHTSSPIKPPVEVPMLAAGGMYSNVHDLSLYIKFHLNNGSVNENQIIKRELLNEMLSVPNRKKNQATGYALGTSVARHGKVNLFSHGGGGYGFLTNMSWCPELNVGVVLLTNSTGHNLNIIIPEMIGNMILEIKYGKAEQTNPDLSKIYKGVIQVDTSFQRKFVGQYLYNRTGYMLLEWQDGKMGIMPGENFRPSNFVSEDELFFITSGVPYYYKFILDENKIPVTMIREYDGEFLDLNDRPGEPAGNFKPEWEKYIGKYALIIYGFPAETKEVMRKNGFLYLDNMKLKEHLPGLFFTVHGETLDLRTDKPTWKNIKIRKLPADDK